MITYSVICISVHSKPHSHLLCSRFKAKCAPMEVHPTYDKTIQHVYLLPLLGYSQISLPVSLLTKVSQSSCEINIYCTL